MRNCLEMLSRASSLRRSATRKQRATTSEEWNAVRNMRATQHHHLPDFSPYYNEFFPCLKFR